MIIEFATEQDIDVIARIEGECFCDESWSKEMIEADFNTRSIYIVTRDDNDIPIAYLSMLDLDGEGEVLRIAVRKQYRRRGIARRMMQYLIDYLKENYYQRIYLEVKSTNAPAISLYKSLGFVAFNERKNYYAQGESAVNYVLVL